VALKTIYTSADEIPSEVASLYVENDGRFVLDIEDVDNHPKVRNLVTANKSNAQKAQERFQELEALRQKLSVLPEDFDPEEYQALKAGKGAKPDEQVQLLKEQHARALAAAQAQSKQAYDTLAQQLAERDSYIDNQTRRDALNAALDEAGFDPMHKPMLTKYLADNIKVRREEDGRRVAFSETDLGDVSPLELVKSFASREGKAYLAKPSGPGAQGNGSKGYGNKTITRAQFAQLDPVSQAKAMADKIQLVD
jgi:hypothetical protein